jgi:hypothetical protein
MAATWTSVSGNLKVAFDKKTKWARFHSSSGGGTSLMIYMPEVLFLNPTGLEIVVATRHDKQFTLPTTCSVDELSSPGTILHEEQVSKRTLWDFLGLRTLPGKVFPAVVEDLMPYAYEISTSQIRLLYLDGPTLSIDNTEENRQWIEYEFSDVGNVFLGVQEILPLNS